MDTPKSNQEDLNKKTEADKLFNFAPEEDAD